MHDPLGIFTGRPIVPPWAVQFALHPPYPGGSFDEYLDPASRYYRPDVVAALAEHRRRHEAQLTAEDAAQEQRAAAFRARLAAVHAAQDPFERAAALVALGTSYVGIADLAWETWRRLRATGLLTPTHDLVRLRIKAPILRARFTELERRPAWESVHQTGYIGDDDEAFEPRSSPQPYRWDDEPWFAVAAGQPVRASVASRPRSGQRYTAIEGSALHVCKSGPDHLLLGVIERIVAER